MANREHLAKLREGVDAWNEWVRTHDNFFISDLSRANFADATLTDAILSHTDLRGAYLIDATLIDATLSRANLHDATLSFANLSGADLSRANLHHAILSHATLAGADLTKADLSRADLDAADLSRANLHSADLIGANLSGASLGRANLTGANLSYADLSNADLNQAILYETVFSNTDLSDVKGLDGLNHLGPSTVDHRTMQKTSPRLSDRFLRGCGFTDWQIVSTQLFQEDLSLEAVNDIGYEIIKLRSERPIQLNPIFISYSRKDSSFVDRVEERFNDDGIRFWRDVHDATAGRMDRQIERAISLNPIVFLVLSKNSVQSDWVEWEAEKARKLEKEQKRDVLCPVALDDAWKTSDWDPILRKQIERYNILDFKKWVDAAAFAGGYEKLRKGLRLFYQGEAS